MATIQAIQDNDLIFVSAQPDTIYFHWQVELYLYQFSKHGPKIADRCYAIFGYEKDGPSRNLVELSKKYKNIIWYKDDRIIPKENYYIPSIRPHLFKKFFKEKPELGRNVFFHDSDIFIVHVPKFELMLNDDIGYLSDTISYIGAKYIKDCATRYKSKYPELDENDIFKKMCDCIGITQELVESNQDNSGGAQYLLKNIDESYWEEVETKCMTLYDMLKKYEKNYPIDHHIQSWTAGMWADLWVYWKNGKKTLIHKELEFSWATWTIKDYESKNIFHLAGITGENKSDKFYKGQYVNKNIFDEYKKNPTIFDHVSKDNATYAYTNVIKEYCGTVFTEVPIINKNTKTFKLITNDHLHGQYTKDESTKYFDKPVWRSEHGYIAFYNSRSWTITQSKYENEISEKCGGFATNNAEEPYENNWNIECKILLM